VVSVGMGLRKRLSNFKVTKIKTFKLRVFMSLRGWEKKVVSVVQHNEKRESIMEKKC
jgi:hypothetical protein